mmetsp:Transcript_4202/g.11882  ORF Transcript_4202/g.11882 Transcript_4202/m.11882 type:complete len:141 (+) Transcript_4202:93-515(+)
MDDNDSDDARERVLAEREARAKQLIASAEELDRTATRLERLNAAATLNASAAEAERSARRHEQRAAAQRLDEEAGEMERASTRMERSMAAGAAAELDALTDETKELILTVEENIKLREEARAFRASLLADDPSELKPTCK